MRIPFDSLIWQEDKYAIAALEGLRHWQEAKPTVDEFVRFVESHTDSDYNYESFYYILPYVLDELESRTAKEQFEMIPLLDWKLLKCQEGNLPDRCYDQLSECENRIVELLRRMNAEPGCPAEVMRYNRGAIAAMEGDYELGEQIMNEGE
jgi:hypothetical protein